MPWRTRPQREAPSPRRWPLCAPSWTDAFNDEDILTAIGRALEASRTRLDHEAELLALRKRHGSLSGREQEVMALVVTGLLNKQIAFQLGISEITVKAHRGKVMRKMEASNLVDLIVMAARLGLSVPPRSYRLSA